MQHVRQDEIAIVNRLASDLFTRIRLRNGLAHRAARLRLGLLPVDRRYAYRHVSLP